MDAPFAGPVRLTNAAQGIPWPQPGPPLHLYLRSCSALKSPVKSRGPGGLAPLPWPGLPHPAPPTPQPHRFDGVGITKGKPIQVAFKGSGSSQRRHGPQARSDPAADQSRSATLGSRVLVSIPSVSFRPEWLLPVSGELVGFIFHLWGRGFLLLHRLQTPPGLPPVGPSTPGPLSRFTVTRAGLTTFRHSASGSGGGVGHQTHAGTRGSP